MRGVVDDTTPGREWWRNAVIYQLYVRSFADHNGDGTGDLRGIIDHLDYIEELGVDGVWLNPCYPSPQHDHGYDVSDYFDIEPAYGSLEVFDELMAAANARGIRVLMDVVPNHCSSRHPWFLEAIAAGRAGPARERFYFADGNGPNGELPPNDWQSVFNGSAWTRVAEPDGSPGQWYLHTFTPEQPDLRADHADVLEHFRRMFRFWFDRGVDGFRVDAIMVMGKEAGLPDATPAPPGTHSSDRWQFNRHTINHPSLFPVVGEWRKVFDDYQREHSRVLVSVSEAYTPRKPEVLRRYVGPSRFHQSFVFDLLLEPWSASHFERAIRSNYDALTSGEYGFAWTLNNHDVQRAVTRYGRLDADTFYSGNNLINSTATVDLVLGARRARCALMLMLALPGCAYLYMGEELGLPEVLDLPDDRRTDPLFHRSKGALPGRDGCRVPMPWSADAGSAYGFSPLSQSTWLPQPTDWGTYAVEHQAANPGSMLNFYRRVLRLRSLFVAQGDALQLEREADLLIMRRGRATMAMNFGERPSPLEIDERRSASILVTSDDTDASRPIYHAATGLAPNSAVWWLRR